MCYSARYFQFLSLLDIQFGVRDTTRVTMWFYVVVASMMVASTFADTENVVGVLSGISGYNQIVTSSTLRWLTPADGKVPEHAVQAAEQKDNADEEDVLRKVWVCRARAHTNNMWVAGVLTKDQNGNGKCIASSHGMVQPYHSYEVLQNVEDGARLSWMPWDKLHYPPGGSVTIGSEPMTLFIGRRKSSDPTSAFDYHLGRIEGSLMGRIVVVENGVEKSYDDGEVLVETEPIRYEMTNVKFNKFRDRAYREPLILGSTTMRNEDEPTDDGNTEEASRVDTVIAYNHNQTVSWGQGHAILSGLMVKVLHANGSIMDEFPWAIDSFKNHSSIYQVETFLAPGRGVNVTLTGNWTESNMPYTAKVIAIYADGAKKSRMISGSKREVGIRDVHPEFGPVYYLHNNTHVPTTTTTTTSTTTTKSTTTVTTSRTSTSTDAKPIPASPMEELNSTTKKGDLATPERKKENQSWPNDAPKSESVERKSNSADFITPGGPVLLFTFVVLSLST